ncbi:MAG: hypothetical protein JST16_05550 [Bdellovibrionales bacterium]|nr:hypothetical protein [Bdellovibrionales bacterium]
MNQLKICALASLLSLAPTALAQRAAVGLTDIPASADGTSIVIRKGDQTTQNQPDYQIIEGREEIAGDPTADRKQALASWKEACAEWKSSLKDMNKGNIITLNCGVSTVEKKEYLFTVQSVGTYRLRVRIKDPVIKK